MKEIQLTKGFVAIVDDEDFEMLNQWKWKYIPGGYACRQESRKIAKLENRPRKTIYMHGVILPCPDDKEVDHIDLNKLNNQKYNLRIATHSQNNHNTRMQKDNTSGYKGVYFRKDRGKFQSRIMNEGKEIKLGCFKSAIDAAKVYDEAAIKLHGEFARLNFPKETNA